MSKHKDAPRLVNVGVWGGAILGSLVLALSVGIYFYGLLNNPISADTQTSSSNCPTGTTQIAINNYPTTLLNGGHSAYYSDGDMNFRCSHICVSSPSSQGIYEELNGKNIGGNPVAIYRTADDFNKDIEKGGPEKEKAMKRGVILSSIKTSCTGPNSVNYESITSADGEEEVSRLERDDTSYQPSAADAGVESSYSREEASMGYGTVAGPTEELKINTEYQEWTQGDMKYKKEGGKVYYYDPNSESWIYERSIDENAIFTAESVYRKWTGEDGSEYLQAGDSIFEYNEGTEDWEFVAYSTDTTWKEGDNTYKKDGDSIYEYNKETKKWEFVAYAKDGWDVWKKDGVTYRVNNDTVSHYDEKEQAWVVDTEVTESIADKPLESGIGHSSEMDKKILVRLNEESWWRNLLNKNDLSMEEYLYAIENGLFEKIKNKSESWDYEAEARRPISREIIKKITRQLAEDGTLSDLDDLDLTEKERIWIKKYDLDDAILYAAEKNGQPTSQKVVDWVKSWTVDDPYFADELKIAGTAFALMPISSSTSYLKAGQIAARTSDKSPGILQSAWNYIMGTPATTVRAKSTMGVQPLSRVVVPGTPSLPSRIAGGVIKAVKSIPAATASAGTTIASTARSVVDRAGSAVTSTVQRASSLAQSARTFITGSPAREVGPRSVMGVKPLSRTIPRTPSIVERTVTAARSAGSAVVEGVKSAGSRAVGAVRGLWGRITGG